MKWGRQVLLATVLQLVAFGPPPASSARGRADEELVKAEFVERFTRFIDWPPSALPPRSSFDLCVVGKTKVGARLEELSHTREFKRRDASYKRVRSLSNLDACHLVFIAPSETERLDHILHHTHGKPILTIGDTRGYARRGVIINLYASGNALRFEINIATALESGLRFRSKLLKLARLVGAKNQGGL